MICEICVHFKVFMQMQRDANFGREISLDNVT